MINLNAFLPDDDQIGQVVDEGYRFMVHQTDQSDFADDPSRYLTYCMIRRSAKRMQMYWLIGLVHNLNAAPGGTAKLHSDNARIKEFLERNTTGWTFEVTDDDDYKLYMDPLQEPASRLYRFGYVTSLVIYWIMMACLSICRSLFIERTRDASSTDLLYCIPTRYPHIEDYPLKRYCEERGVQVQMLERPVLFQLSAREIINCIPIMLDFLKDHPDDVREVERELAAFLRIDLFGKLQGAIQPDNYSKILRYSIPIIVKAFHMMQTKTNRFGILFRGGSEHSLNVLSTVRDEYSNWTLILMSHSISTKTYSYSAAAQKSDYYFVPSELTMKRLEKGNQAQLSSVKNVGRMQFVNLYQERQNHQKESDDNQTREDVTIVKSNPWPDPDDFARYARVIDLLDAIVTEPLAYTIQIKKSKRSDLDYSYETDRFRQLKNERPVSFHEGSAHEIIRKTDLICIHPSTSHAYVTNLLLEAVVARVPVFLNLLARDGHDYVNWAEEMAPISFQSMEEVEAEFASREFEDIKDELLHRARPLRRTLYPDFDPRKRFHELIERNVLGGDQPCHD